MKIIQVALNSLVLVFADVAGIALGAVAGSRIMGASNQIWLQLPIAIVLSLGFFCLWLLALRGLKLTRLQPVSWKELGACLVASVLMSPLVFVPLHYFSQGYVTGVGNLMALVLYQLPVNALALVVAWIMQTSKRNSAVGNAPHPGR
jgi:hypothetical protein